MKKKIKFLNSIKGWMSIELTNSCNYRCSYCYRKFVDKMPEQFISIKIVNELVKDLENNSFSFDGLKLNWLGESMLHPQFYEILRILFKSKVFEHYSQETNFYLYDNRLFTVNPDDRPYYIFISLDTLEDDLFFIKRGSNTLGKVLDNIHLILNTRKKLNRNYPKIRLQFIVMEDNFQELCFIRDKVHSIFGIKDISFYEDIKAEHDYILFRPLVTREENYKNIKLFRQLKEKYGIKEKKIDENIRLACEKLFSTPFIRADGTLIFCSNDPEMSLSLGNIKNTSFSKLWLGEFMEKLRTLHINREWEKLPEKCRKCHDYWDSIPEEILKEYLNIL